MYGKKVTPELSGVSVSFQSLEQLSEIERAASRNVDMLLISLTIDHPPLSDHPGVVLFFFQTVSTKNANKLTNTQKPILRTQIIKGIARPIWIRVLHEKMVQQFFTLST